MRVRLAPHPWPANPADLVFNWRRKARIPLQTVDFIQLFDDRFPRLGLRKILSPKVRRARRCHLNLNSGYRKSPTLVIPAHPLLLSAFVLADSALPRGSAYRVSAARLSQSFTPSC